jgi:hypothetical protein
MSDETKCPKCKGSGRNPGCPVACNCEACHGSGKSHPQPVETTPGGRPDVLSPLPWHADQENRCRIYDDNYTFVAEADSHQDAAFIVRAVNAPQRAEPVNGNESALAHAERMHAENARLRAVHKRHKRELRRLNAVIRTNNMVMQAQGGQLLALQSASFKRHSEPVGSGGVARERIEAFVERAKRFPGLLDGPRFAELVRHNLLGTTPPAADPVATRESEAWSVLRELVPLLYYNTTPEYIDAVKRARALLAKVE